MAASAADRSGGRPMATPIWTCSSGAAAAVRRMSLPIARRSPKTRRAAPRSSPPPSDRHAAVWADDAPASLRAPPPDTLPARVPYAVIGAGITQIQKTFAAFFNKDMATDGSQFDLLIADYGILDVGPFLFGGALRA